MRHAVKGELLLRVDVAVAVRARVEITLKNRNLKKEQFIEEAAFTPSGVVRVAKLQHEGAAYIKP